MVKNYRVENLVFGNIMCEVANVIMITNMHVYLTKKVNILMVGQT